MIKKHTLHLYILLGVYLILYFISTIFQSKFFGDILSPIGTLISFFILIYVYKKSERFKSVWLILSLGSLIWSVTDILWAICELLIRINPENMTIFDFFYLGTNICIVIAGYIYMKKFMKGVNLVQFFIDVSAISISCFIIFGLLFLHGSFNLFIENVNNIIEFIYIITDLLIINCILSGLFSVRKGKLTKGVYITILGTAIYAVVDLVYVYEYFYNLYVTNSVIDFMYAMSLLIIAFGGLTVLKYSNFEWAGEFYSKTKNIGSAKKGLYLLLTIPVYVIFGGFDFSKILALLYIFVAYEILSNYVQKAINNETLLTYEKDINSILEEKIKERTKELLLKNQELEYISNHDPITNVYNRRYLNKRLQYIINEKKLDNQVTILYIDVDGFKTINDTYGHDIGDYVLIEISNRLKRTIKENNILARLGGDEFVIIIEGKLSKEEIEKICEKLISSCKETIYSDNYLFNVTISIGVAIFPHDAMSRNVIMKNADIAMYDAKSRGKNRYSFFDSHVSNEILERGEIELLLRNVDYDREFELYYQPQIDINTNKLIGVEALIRWHSPIMGNIPPNKFIKIAEETGSIEKIGQWVMNTAAKQIGIWNEKFDSNIRMSINISPNQLVSIDFASDLEKIMKKYGLKSDWIDIEITENIAMKGEGIFQQIFSILDGMGISISIDDFGTGYSSLSYIQKFSFNRLKIAKELIDNITIDLNKRHIVKAIVMLSEGLNILTIAEGVETEDQLNIVKEIGCNQVQGYVYSKPVTADRFEKEFLLQI
ncbi:histidine kinase [Clostridium acetobutylicum]|nr:histidine kinase [Clostridium acetobutylicum]